jgi:hypothetical protein
MVAINTGSFPKLLKPGIAKIFGNIYENYTPIWSKVFETVDSKLKYEEAVEVTGFGLAGVKAEGGNTRYDSAQQGYVNRAQNITYALGFEITQEALMFNQYLKEADFKSKMLGFSMTTTKEINGADIFNKGFTAGYTYGDGQVLFSSAHPTLSGNQSNLISADLSEAALEDMAVLIGQFKNSKGLIVKAQPKALVVPTALKFEACRILKSVQQPGTANNDINAIKTMGMFPEIIENPYLDDTDAFFATTSIPAGFTQYNASPIKLRSFEDIDSGNMKTTASETYVFTVNDWRAGVGSAGV